MCEKIDDIVTALRVAVTHLDARELSGEDAAALVSALAEAGRLVDAGRTIAVGRVSETRAWFGSGHRTAAQWLAARTRGSLSEAITEVQAAHHLANAPTTFESFRAGRISSVQAAEIASTAAVDPGAERELLALAERGQSASYVRDRCREVRAAAGGDEDAAERIRRGRYLRDWVDTDGAVRLNARLAPDDGAVLLAVVAARTNALADEARRSGQREPTEAYRADALVALAGGPGAPKAVVHVEVDASALERGHTVAGETCRIAGVGPVPVATVHRMAAHGVVKVVGRDGTEVTHVAHLGRTIPAHVRTALEARDPACVVPGCDVRERLEIDHIVPLSDGGATSLDNLARLCRWHHAQKTHHGWALAGPPGTWTWTRVGGTGRTDALARGARAGARSGAGPSGGAARARREGGAGPARDP